MSQPLLPLAPRTVTQSSEEVSRRKQPKSRNGCVTCKARRMKCDESKPTCQQCSRRGVPCGGYPKYLRWKSVGPSKDNGLPRLPKVHILPAEDQLGLEPLESGTSTSHYVCSAPSHERSERGSRKIVRSSPDDTADTQRSFNETTVVERRESIPDGDGDGDGHNIGGECRVPFPKAQQPLSLPPLIEAGRLLSTLGTDRSPYQSSPFSISALQGNSESLGFDDSDWNMYGLEDLFRGTEVAWEPGTGLMALEQHEPELGNETALISLVAPSEGVVSTQETQAGSVTRETIQQLFENRTCGILSIKEDQTRNPWRTLVWPLATHCPALYHALAAMACLHMCKLQPQFRLPGLQHFEHSMRSLSGDGNMQVETIVATRLALALAASWDREKSSTVIDHTNAARILIRQASYKERISELRPTELSRLSFFANTCLYMDVIARLTCTDPQSSHDSEFMAACSMLSSSIPSKQQLDPLMGCAITLFPLIGRLAELVGRVRKRTERRNSPAIVSKAIELRMAIEGWVPLITSQGPVGLNTSLADSIQTAEAYRWASLLLLRQAVPELPWAHSLWELASKSLVFLATIPLSSRTTIVQTFPLMLAGCEATEDDDRDWVRERWSLMSKCMITGIVDRCKEITSEVWRRRDEYEIRHGLRSRSHYNSPSIGERSPLKAGQTPDTSALEPGLQETKCAGSDASPCAEHLDFPDSAAFKKGIDPVTRAGHLHYTVKGQLHCFGVMSDWDWHGKLPLDSSRRGDLGTFAYANCVP
ncbi:hypothetical protein G647_04077 [Cladophialophora carrionii CBS 160.54]|uniref:Zn(2)-C6 fungal-type domain-containing protein n=1 Tax=Cladophialophora carrionii CBS 160.54 TaxID=1279043 RepID=V9DEE9_9EURO|nr:uncharacterized protein G647_04077 [Cladophialophora carrionii CBS 160.54]ETI24708.1 hypothetical protein G647_04077 [Cladophialophora carrionii CBS 160.54]